MHASHWRTTSERVIEDACRALPADADRRAIEAAVNNAYPFGERAMWPYKQWLVAKADVLARRFPSLYKTRGAKRAEREIERDGGGLFAGD